MKKVFKKIKKFILENKKNLLLGLISLVAFIIGGISINWVFSFIIIAIIDVLLFFGPTILNYFKGLKKNKKTVKKKTKNKKRRGSSCCPSSLLEIKCVCFLSQPLGCFQSFGIEAFHIPLTLA